MTINPNVRIGIGIHRTDGGNNEALSVRFGTESQDSPRESYDDASEDFNFLGRFNHDRPTPTVNDTVGGTTAGQIYGNPEIFYQIIHTHASLVGDGNVSAGDIDSGNADDGDVLTADGSGNAAFETPPASGLSESEVDARVTAGVEDFAGNRQHGRCSPEQDSRGRHAYRIGRDLQQQRHHGIHPGDRARRRRHPVRGSYAVRIELPRRPSAWQSTGSPTASTRCTTGTVTRCMRTT